MKNHNKAFRITILSMFSAITFILMYTPLGTIPVGNNTVSIFHIPILISSIVLGLGNGLIIGFVAGFASLSRAILQPMNPMDAFYINPFVSIFPRMLIAVTTFYSYKFFKKFSFPETIKTTVPVIIGNLTNTIGVYSMLYLFYGKEIVAEFNGEPFFNVMIGLMATSTLIKAIFVAIITVPIIIALNKYIKSNNIF